MFKRISKSDWMPQVPMKLENLKSYNRLDTLKLNFNIFSSLCTILMMGFICISMTICLAHSTKDLTCAQQQKHSFPNSYKNISNFVKE